MTYENPWHYNNTPFDGPIDGYEGFVYCIKNLTTNRMYIGKKGFYSAKTRMVNKKKKKFRVESTWRLYYGSNETLQADVELLGVSNFSRTILHLCASKGVLSYMELLEQMDRRVLEYPELYYNGFVGGKFGRNHIKPMLK